MLDGRATDPSSCVVRGMGHLCPVLLAKPLFDCAGVAAGVGGMDFPTFFLATVAGKVLVKALMQTAFALVSALHALDGPDSLPNTITWPG